MTVCNFEDFPGMNIYWHTEEVELRTADDAEVVASGTVGFGAPGCPAVLWIDDGPQVHHYPDDEVAVLVEKLVAEVG